MGYRLKEHIRNIDDILERYKIEDMNSEKEVVFIGDIKSKIISYFRKYDSDINIKYLEAYTEYQALSL